MFVCFKKWRNFAKKVFRAQVLTSGILIIVNVIYCTNKFTKNIYQISCFSGSALSCNTSLPSFTSAVTVLVLVLFSPLPISCCTMSEELRSGSSSTHKLSSNSFTTVKSVSDEDRSLVVSADLSIGFVVCLFAPDYCTG